MRILGCGMSEKKNIVLELFICLKIEGRKGCYENVWSSCDQKDSLGLSFKRFYVIVKSLNFEVYKRYYVIICCEQIFILECLFLQFR